MHLIRRFAPSDEPAVASLWRTVFDIQHPWHDPTTDVRRKASFQPELFFVATLEETLVGTAMGGYDGHRGWIYRVAVHPEFRRRGVGRELVQGVEGALQTIGCPKINLQIDGDSASAVAFYESIGFRVEQRVSMGKPLVQSG